MVEYALDDVRETIEIEGFEYALSHYINPEDILDVKLSGMVEEFCMLHTRIEEAIDDSEEGDMLELKSAVESEGLDYTLTDYVHPDDLPDQDLAGQVRDYLSLRSSIVKYLGVEPEN